MSIQHFEITQRGQSHIEDGTKCQDSSGCVETTLGKDGPGAVISVVADGVGSCAFSDEGSRLAVDTALAFLKDKLTQMDAPKSEDILKLLREAFDAACEAMDAYSRGKYPVMEMATTLTLAVMAEDGTAYVGHIGDSGIVAMYADGEYEMVTTRHKGEAANSVFTLYEPDSEAKWEFKRLRKPAAALALMTDGVLDNCVDREKMGSRVYLPFIARALMTSCQSAEKTLQEREFWAEKLQSVEWRKRITDDISFCMVQNPGLVSALPEITFDEEAWKCQTQKVRQEEEQVLHAKGEAQCETMNRKKDASGKAMPAQKTVHMPQERKPGQKAAKAVKPAGGRRTGPLGKMPVGKQHQKGSKSACASRTEGKAAENDDLFTVKKDHSFLKVQLMPAALALLFSAFFNFGLCCLFPHSGTFLRLLSFAGAGVLSLAGVYLIFRSIYCPHAEAPDSGAWFWRAGAIAILAVLIATTLVFMLVYEVWYLIALPSILLFAVAVLLMGL